MPLLDTASSARSYSNDFRICNNPFIARLIPLVSSYRLQINF